MKRSVETVLHIDSAEEDELHGLLASGDVVYASELLAKIRELPDDSVAQTDLKSAKGCLEKYANPLLIPLEKNAWVEAVREKHVNHQHQTIIDS